MTSSSDFYICWDTILQKSFNLKNWIESNFREIVEETYYYNEGLEALDLKANEFLSILREHRSTEDWDPYTARYLDSEIYRMELSASQSSSGKLHFCQKLFKELERTGLVSRDSAHSPPPSKHPKYDAQQHQTRQSNSPDQRTILNHEIEMIKGKIDCWNKIQRVKEQQFTTLTNEVQLDEIELMVRALVDKHWNFVLQNPDAKEAIFNLTKSLFVVSTQPMQHDRRIIRYNQKFKTIVRFLFPKEYLSGGTQPTVTVQIINQKRANVVDLQNNTVNLSPQNGNGHLEALFNPKLPATKPVKLDKAQSNLTTVHDENFWAHYVLKVHLHGLELEQRVIHLTSFPFKIIGNSSQDMGALETLIWGNAAEVFDVVPIELRQQKLPFKDVTNAINAAMQPYGKEFSGTDFTRVVRKVLGPQILDVILKSGEITFEQYRSAQEVEGLGLFDVKNRPITKISFWGWFYYLIEFISEHLCSKESKPGFGPWWKENKVLGYLTNEESVELLRSRPEHTVLIRFSNSKPDAVTLEWIVNNKLYSYRATDSELQERSLLNRVMDIELWQYVYPDEGKENLFGNGLTNLVSCGSSSFSFPHGIQNQRFPNHNVKRYGYVHGHVKAYLEIPEDDSPIHESFKTKLF